MKAARSTKPKPKKRSAGRTLAPGVVADPFSADDLPPELAAELEDRMAQAQRGEDLWPADQALAEAKRLSDAIVERVRAAESQRPPAK